MKEAELDELKRRAANGLTIADTDALFAEIDRSRLEADRLRAAEHAQMLRGMALADALHTLCVGLTVVRSPLQHIARSALVLYGDSHPSSAEPVRDGRTPQTHHMSPNERAARIREPKLSPESQAKPDAGHRYKSGSRRGMVGEPVPHDMAAPDGPTCGCGEPSAYESGWCGKTCRAHREQAKPKPTAEEIAALQRLVNDLDERFMSYAGGDRPMSPPAELQRELFAAETALSNARQAASAK